MGQDVLEVLCVERVGDELIKLVRRGREFRVVNTVGDPAAKVQHAAHSTRLRFGTSEVAWLAFDFVVATERFWDATLRGSRRLRLLKTMRRASDQFRAAAIRRHDPPGVAALTALLATSGSNGRRLSLAITRGIEAMDGGDSGRPA